LCLLFSVQDFQLSRQKMNFFVVFFSPLFSIKSDLPSVWPVWCYYSAWKYHYFLPREKVNYSQHPSFFKMSFRLHLHSKKSSGDSVYLVYWIDIHTAKKDNPQLKRAYLDQFANCHLFGYVFILLSFTWILEFLIRK
jgi:hypothetical protein